MVGNTRVGPPCNTSDVIWLGDAAKKSLKIAMAAYCSLIYHQPYCMSVIVGAMAAMTRLARLFVGSWDRSTSLSGDAWPRGPCALVVRSRPPKAHPSATPPDCAVCPLSLRIAASGVLCSC